MERPDGDRVVRYWRQGASSGNVDGLGVWESLCCQFISGDSACLLNGTALARAEGRAGLMACFCRRIFIANLFRTIRHGWFGGKQCHGQGVEGRQSAPLGGTERQTSALQSRGWKGKRPLGARVASRAPAMALRSLLLTLVLWAVTGSLWMVHACADGVVPRATELPPMLGLDDALRVFHTHGLDLLIAEPPVTNAEGPVKIPGAPPHPVVSGSVAKALTHR